MGACAGNICFPDTMMELCTKLSNMVPSPYSEVELVRLPSPEIIKGIPAGAESDTGSSVIDSGDEWDKTEVGVWSRCPTLMAKIGPTWAEVHAAMQEEMIKKQDSTWEDIVSRQLPGGAEEEDWGREEGSHRHGGAPVRRRHCRGGRR